MSDVAVARTSLVRALGPLDGTAIIVGGIIGTGIFVSPGLIARETGAPGLSMIVWLVAGLLALSGGLCYAELSAAIPETGGTYVYLRRAYPWSFVAFSFGWTFFFVDGPGAIAAVGAVFVSYLAYFFPGLSPEHPAAARACSAAVIVALTAVNVLGVRTGGRVQGALTILKLVALAAIVSVALAANAHGSITTPVLPSGDSAADAMRRVASALMPAMFAFGGWTYTSYVSGEMRHPERNIPLSIVGGVLIVLLVYLGVNAAVLRALPFDVVRVSPHVASDAMQAALGPKGAAVVAIAVMVSALGAINAIVLSYSRIAFAMSRDAYFFTALARIEPRFRSPLNAILVQGAVACAFAMSGSFDDILGYFSFVEYVFFSLGVAALVVLRIREPLLARPVRTWLYPLPPVLFLTVSALYLANLLWSHFAGSMVGVGLLLIGVPFYRHWSRVRPNALPTHAP